MCSLSELLSLFGSDSSKLKKLLCKAGVPLGWSWTPGSQWERDGCYGNCKAFWKTPAIPFISSWLSPNPNPNPNHRSNRQRCRTPTSKTECNRKSFLTEVITLYDSFLWNHCLPFTFTFFQPAFYSWLCDYALYSFFKLIHLQLVFLIL